MHLPLFYCLQLLGGSVCGQIAPDSPLPRQHLEITGRHVFRITYTYATIWPKGGGSHGVFHLPLPPTTGNQEILTVVSSLKGEVRQDGDRPPRRLLTVIVHHENGNERRLEWEVCITGKFVTRQLVDGPPATTQKLPTAPGPDQFLAATESLDWKVESFQVWLDRAGLRRTPAEEPVAYGRQLYAYLAAHGDYCYPPQGGWTASGAVRRLRTDCGGFSLIFTAACRANRIPARLLVGQWFKMKAGPVTLEQTGRQAHVIAEFFDPRIGWIPEDISSTFLRTPGYADLNFFGRDPGYFFTWHWDTDFHFTVPTQADEHVQWIQNPSPWFSADAADAAGNSSHHWTLEVLQ